MTDDQRQEGYRWSGVLPPPGARFPKDGPVRITVELDPRNPNLHEWLPWARRCISPEWMAQLHPIAGGNMQKAKTWRLFFGVIPAAAFLAVDVQPERRQLRRA
jgi:hypothetical protein